MVRHAFSDNRINNLLFRGGKAVRSKIICRDTNTDCTLVEIPKRNFIYITQYSFSLTLFLCFFLTAEIRLDAPKNPFVCRRMRRN